MSALTFTKLMDGDFPEPTYAEKRLSTDWRAAHSFMLHGWIDEAEYFRLVELIKARWGK